MNYELQIDSLPDIKLKSFEKYKAIEYKVNIEDKIINEKLNEISNQNKQFKDKKENEKAKIGDQVVFDYSATVDRNKFEGSEGKGVQLELGKDLFLKGFDKQLVGVKNKVDDNFAKNMGAKDLNDLKKLIENQISSQYSQALNSITKKEILDQIEKNHDLDIPKNLIEQEISIMTQSLKDEDKAKHKTNNEKIATSRIKLGLILNEYGEKNNLKVSDEEVKAEIQKQIKGMPGQEKMVLDYYHKNPSASQSLKGSIYEEKIINLIKSKIKLETKNINTKEAEKIISEFNKQKVVQTDVKKTASPKKIQQNQKKLVKSNQ